MKKVRKIFLVSDYFDCQLDLNISVKLNKLILDNFRWRSYRLKTSSTLQPRVPM